jgi:hypothetical protein
MSAWMTIAVVATAQVVLELVRAAAYAWRERARSRSNRSQIEAAAEADALVQDQRGPGSTLLIVPLRSRHDS